METLGLTGNQRQEDGFFRRLFWPTIQNHYDVDTSSRRGFWLATIVGLLSGIGLLIQAHPVLAFLTSIVFLLGACGIREKDAAASVLIFAIYCTGIIFQWTASLMGVGRIGNPLVSLVCIAILASCVRATVLSRKLLLQGDYELPDVTDTGFLSRVSNQTPRIIWPKARYLFFVVAGLYLAFSIIGYTRALMVIHKTHTTVPSQEDDLQ